MSTMSIFDLTDTWNSAGTTFNAIKMNVTDTASAAGSLLMDLQVGGASRFSVTKAGATSIGSQISFNNANVSKIVYDSAYGDPNLAFYTGGSGDGIKLYLGSTNNVPVAVIPSSGAFCFSGATNPTSAVPDTYLFRDAADTLAQRRGTNAQAFRIYNTFTDASNYERGEVHWVSNVFRVGTYAAGTGTGRTLTFLTSGVERWSINAGNGHFLAVADNTYDIGASGANRPRAIYTAGLVSVGGLFTQKGRFAIDAPTDGVAVFYNNANTDFSRLQFGGTTSSFPALKRNGTALETKLADDSAYAPHAAQYLDVTDGVTAPAAATGRARIYVDTADGDLKVIFADGTIKTIVTDT